MKVVLMWDDQKGQNLVIAALSMAVLLAMLALVLDGSMALAQRRRMQNAADAGALSGAWTLIQGGSGSEVYSRINEYTVERNHATAFTAFYQPSGSEVTSSGSVPSETTSITVYAQVTQPTAFATVIGLDEVSVQAESAAGLVTASYSGGNYAIWGDSESCENTVEWHNDEMVIDGAIHTNHDAYLDGNENTVTGALEYVTDYYIRDPEENNIDSDNIVQTAPTPMPIEYNIEDFRPGGSKAEAAGTQYQAVTGDLEIWQEGGNLHYSLYYATGDITVHLENMGEQEVTFVAEGRISIEGESTSFKPYNGGPLVFSNYDGSESGPSCTYDPEHDPPAIWIKNDGNHLMGVVYAPNGVIKVDGDEHLIEGGLYGNKIELDSDETEIVFDNTYFPETTSVRLVPLTP